LASVFDDQDQPVINRTQSAKNAALIKWGTVAVIAFTDQTLALKVRHALQITLQTSVGRAAGWQVAGSIANVWHAEKPARMPPPKMFDGFVDQSVRV
tara:strand:+ start:55 stop:345 length:291 start_codon:yes stop_codon:yes gene_type:complete